MPEATKILLTAVASAIFTGILAFASQKLIERWFTRSLEKFKVDLQLGAFEHQTRFTRLHEKRAEVIAELYVPLVKTQRDFTAMLDPVPTLSINDEKTNKINMAREAANNFVEYFDEHRIFLDSELCAKLSHLAQEFREIYLRFWTTQSSLTTSTNIDMLNAWSGGIDKLNKEIPQLREEIEIRFRKMLGDTHNVESNTCRAKKRV